MLSSILLSVSLLMTQPDPVVGNWTSVDDATGKEKSEIRLYFENGKLYGRIERLLLPEDAGKLCVECEGDNKNKPIEGLVIVQGLEKDGDSWIDGIILDPANGKNYSCTISLNQDGTLNVRGYLGFSLLGRTQVWKPKK